MGADPGLLEDHEEDPMIMTESMQDLSKSEYRKMMDWAFGQDFKRMLHTEAKDAWNRRHGNIFIIHGSDEVQKTIDKIFKAWKHRENYPPSDLDDKCQNVR